MKAALVALTSIGLVAAQDRADYFPECSLDCLDEATEDVTDCSVDDAVCWCVQSNYEAIYDSGVSCVLRACGNDVAVGEVLPAAIVFCSAATSMASEASATSTHASSSAAATDAAATSAASDASATSEATSEATGTQASSTASATESSPTSESEDAAESDPPSAASIAGPLGVVSMLLLGVVAWL